MVELKSLAKENEDNAEKDYKNLSNVNKGRIT